MYSRLDGIGVTSEVESAENDWMLSRPRPGETREIIFGYSHSGRLLLVCFTEREDGIRIINACKPDKDERHHHEEESRR
jgi:uncharacterized DUF497 family protein